MTRPLVDLFGDVVAKANAVILPYLQTVNARIEGLHYEYGHPEAILLRMVAYSKTQEYAAKKYPLVALLQDFAEPTAAKAGQLSSISVRVVIANITQATYTTEQRYEANFKPILQPVYEEIMRQLSTSGIFRGRKVPQHTKYDRPFWGKEGLYGSQGNIFDDCMDCIEIKDLQLIIPPVRACVPANFKNF